MYSMTDNQFTVAHATFVDKKGQPVTPTSPPTWLTDNTDVLALTPAADGLSCKITAVGPVTASPVSVSVSAATATGDIHGSEQVTITPSAPASITLALDPPTEQP